MKRQIALLAVELLALATVVGGVALLFVPAALIVGGLVVVIMVERA